MGVSPKTLQFLKELANNNNRPWFQDHKEEYLAAKADFDGFVEYLFEKLEGPYELDFSTPKECLHRIYRNLRFSKDKTPYKTGLSADINPAGKKGLVSGLYLRIDPTQGCIIGGGVWHPDSHSLTAIREEIMENGEKLETILAENNLQKYFGKLEGETLKTAPRGIDKDHRFIDLLRHKDFVLFHKFTQKEVLSKDFADEIVSGALIMKPFLDFLRHAMRRRPVIRK